MRFRFKCGDIVRSTDYKDSDIRQSRGEVVWLENDGQFAIRVDRSRHGLSPYTNKVVCWDNYRLSK